MDWAFLTPADAAVTVITSPIPSARPTAIKMAWRARRRSSRQRYVKNIGLLNGQHEFKGTDPADNAGGAVPSPTGERINP